MCTRGIIEPLRLYRSFSPKTQLDPGLEILSQGEGFWPSLSWVKSKRASCPMSLFAGDLSSSDTWGIPAPCMQVCLTFHRLGRKLFFSYFAHATLNKNRNLGSCGLASTPGVNTDFCDVLPLWIHSLLPFLSYKNFLYFSTISVLH